MPDYDDLHHVPHGTHYGEEPRNPIVRGPYGIDVRLLDWGPNGPQTMAALWCALQANWGDAPERSVLEREMNEDQWAYVEACFKGRTLQQALERFTFSFCIDGVTRAATHQIVRTRLGAGFMQHGGRDNDWRHRPWTMPETIDRACDLVDGQVPRGTHCVTDVRSLAREVARRGHNGEGDGTLRGVIRHHLNETRLLYAALVDAGIPWQDARRLLPIGMQTYLFADYNYLGLKGVLGNRLEHVMDWEINCVAQLMVREVRTYCPSVLWRPLKSHSDRAQRAAFENLDSWPPDGKYPVSQEAARRQRTHRAEQMPFFVLTEDAMNGDEVQWMVTDGRYDSRRVDPDEAASIASAAEAHMF